MIRAVNVGMTIHAASIERKDIEAGGSLMSRQKIDVTLLAKLMRPSRQQFRIVRAVRGMTNQAIFLNWRVLIK